MSWRQILEVDSPEFPEFREFTLARSEKMPEIPEIRASGNHTKENLYHPDHGWNERNNIFLRRTEWYAQQGMGPPEAYEAALAEYKTITHIYVPTPDEVVGSCDICKHPVFSRDTRIISGNDLCWHSQCYNMK